MFQKIVHTRRLCCGSTYFAACQHSCKARQTKQGWPRWALEAREHVSWASLACECLAQAQSAQAQCAASFLCYECWATSTDGTDFKISAGNEWQQWLPSCIMALQDWEESRTPIDEIQLKCLLTCTWLTRLTSMWYSFTHLAITMYVSCLHLILENAALKHGAYSSLGIKTYLGR